MVLAGLEELTSPRAFERWLAQGAYDVVMPDVKYAGGIRALVAIGALCAKHGAACAPHNPSGPVAHAASLAACAAMPAFRVLEHQVDETPRFFAIAGEGLPAPRDGASALPAGPGLGLEPDLRR
jgi:galactonate dehydratase